MPLIAILALPHARRVSFVLPTDRGYQTVKRIRQGKSLLASTYDGFVDHFRDRYGFAPLAVTVDAIARPDG